MAAIAPGMMQAYADRVGFADDTVCEAIALGR
jgi:hypothetical protein